MHPAHSVFSRRMTCPFPKGFHLPATSRALTRATHGVLDPHDAAGGALYPGGDRCPSTTIESQFDDLDLANERKLPNDFAGLVSGAIVDDYEFAGQGQTDPVDLLQKTPEVPRLAEHGDDQADPARRVLALRRRICHAHPQSRGRKYRSMAAPSRCQHSCIDDRLSARWSLARGRARHNQSTPARRRSRPGKPQRTSGRDFRTAMPIPDRLEQSPARRAG